MPDKFIVPQFIDNEDKILGPVTVRQFVLSLAGFICIAIEYRIFTFPYFIVFAIITAAIVGTFGFAKVNGQPFHVFFLNLIETLSRPPLRVWDKNPTDTELRYYLKPQTVPPASDGTTRKERPGSTRLRDLSLTVNTGGVYVPEDEDAS
jgi:hypothetical protein